jgi:hypothetical protein
VFINKNASSFLKKKRSAKGTGKIGRREAKDEG